MNKISLKTFLPHAIAILVFLVISFAYFPEHLEGKILQQSDIRWWEGMSKELRDYQSETGEFTLWTNAMFGGMPTYLIISPPSLNLLKYIHLIFTLHQTKPVCYIFLFLIGFYIALLAFGVNPWLAIAGALAFAFSTNSFTLIEAGHLTKVQAIGYMSPIIGGVYLAFRRKFLLGALITGVFLTLQLLVNHLQMTYYTLIIILIFGIVELVYSIQQKKVISLAKTTGVLIVAVILAIGSNMTNFWLTYEYSKDSTRSKSELSGNLENKTSGLDKDYITAWSYGIDETLTLLIPNFKGGSSHGELTKNSETFELFKRAQGEKNARQAIQAQPLYWGGQPFTGGPVYVGAIVFFLFVLGMFLLKGPVKWWLLITTVLTILLSWGHNFMAFSNLFINHFPGYNKFRDVTMILVIVQFTFPLAAILVIQKLIDGEINKDDLLKYGKISLYIVGGITLFFALFPGLFYDFSSQSDQTYSNQGLQVLVDAWVADRKMLLRNDSLRSLVFILLTASLIYALYIKKIRTTWFYAILSLLILLDMWPVAKRYLNNDDFVSKRQRSEAFQPYQADLQIMADDDLYFRVLDLTADPFKSSRASYFHKSIGGYHGAKLKRYQELIDYHLSQNNMDVFNMLNTKYIILPSQDSPPTAQRNPDALGNAWFANQIRWVSNADEEIEALNNFFPEEEAIIDVRFEKLVGDFRPQTDTTANIVLSEYKPNQITYSYHSSRDMMVVFSDIYYEKGWNANIDGKQHPHFRVNYLLRGMIVPGGTHQILFTFEPSSYGISRKIALASSLLFVLVILGVLGIEIKKVLV